MPSSGVTQPLTHVVVVSPRLGGGVAGAGGGATGVVEASGETGAMGADAVEVGFVTSGPPSHATSDTPSASATTVGHRDGL